jgi:uncharacterized 2Fe-2S/4Fe-4S cluster protein (DUF4445 family)
MTDHFSIDFEPLGKRGTAAMGHNILEAAQAAGVGLASICGGVGTCEECRIQVIKGRVTPPTLVEEASLTTAELASGMRLACQAVPLSDLKLHIPPESLTAPQRLQLEGEEVNVLPEPVIAGPSAYGLALDIGTTKLAAYLVHLESGKTAARAGAMNPQISYGEDVISRIAYADREEHGAGNLHNVLMEALNSLLDGMCHEAGVKQEHVLDAVLVGNTAMHHIAANLPIGQLGRAPFSPAIQGPLTVAADYLGLSLGPSARVYFPPVVAGYVGADHISMLLATNATRAIRPTIALDIGTNTEISLVANGRTICCSCASGPAFEGAHIHEGMRAAPGAIERARWSTDQMIWQTIENQPPVGICGSGILDIVAALQDGRIIKPNGALQDRQTQEFVVVPAAQTELKRNLVVTRKDVHEIQLAKSAIRSGVDTLLKEAGIAYPDLNRFIVAGAFGTYLDIRSAIRVGMFPPLPLDKFKQVGNAAGIGAKLMLISKAKRHEAEEIARSIDYVELTTHSDFTAQFIKNLALEV